MGTTKVRKASRASGQTARKFRRDRYLFVKGLLPAPILEYLKVYYGILLANGEFVADKQCPSSLARAGDPGLDAVLEWIRPRIGRLVGFELVPTYSYTRRYAKGDVLKRHIDRDACEISVTISIAIPAGADPSSIHLKAPGAPARKVDLREGDGCIYAGAEVEHWRERFQADGYLQLFLHFISKRGPNYPELLFDGRDSLGTAYGRAAHKKKT